MTEIIGTVTTVELRSDDDPPIIFPEDTYNVIGIVENWDGKGMVAYVTDQIVDHGEHLVIVGLITKEFKPHARD